MDSSRTLDLSLSVFSHKAKFHRGAAAAAAALLSDLTDKAILKIDSALQWIIDVAKFAQTQLFQVYMKRKGIADIEDFCCCCSDDHDDNDNRGGVV